MAEERAGGKRKPAWYLLFPVVCLAIPVALVVASGFTWLRASAIGAALLWLVRDLARVFGDRGMRTAPKDVFEDRFSMPCEANREPQARARAPTPKGPPEAWLAVYEYPSGPKRVMGIHVKRDEATEEHGEPGPTDWADNPVLAVVKDDPALDVVHNGLCLMNDACVTARKNWFARYSRLLEPFLRDPKPTIAFTYSESRLPDTCSTFFSSVDGPCLLPEGHEWPVCKGCGERMLFIGQLDFRDAPLVPDLPGKALVFHYCLGCMSEDEGRYSLVWLNAKPCWHGEGGGNVPVQLGRPWLLTDYPYPGDQLNGIGDRRFAEEQSVHLNFTCYATKVGGHVFWIQHEDVPQDRAGKPMVYIGQFLGSGEVELGDSGIAYVFYSPSTRETKLRLQCF